MMGIFPMKVFWC
uniref:Uncharacterized protein n=1 Tax=Anguilla anguilla TaxID=7936 RepID=A0A0E9SG77_ANGAN